MKKFPDLLKEGWQHLKEQPVMLVLGAAALIWIPALVICLPVGIVAFVVMGATAAVAKDAAPLMMIPLTIGAMVVFAAGYNAIRVGWTNMVLKKIKGEPIAWGDFKEALPYFWPFCIFNVCLGMATGLLAITFIGIPVAVIIAARTAFAPFIILEEGLPPLDAAKRSNELVTGVTLEVVGYYLLLVVANFVAGSLPLVNIAAQPAAMAYFDLVLAAMYMDRKEER